MRSVLPVAHGLHIPYILPIFPGYTRMECFSILDVKLVNLGQGWGGDCEESNTIKLHCSLRCCRIWCVVEVQFSNLFYVECEKIVRNIFLCMSMAYNVISCIEVAEITQTLKVADFSM